MGDLVSLGDLKTLLNITDSKYDSLLKLLNTSVTSLIESYCGRHFSDGTYVEYRDGCGETSLYTYEWPITSVISIYDDVSKVYDSSTLIDSTSYTVIAADGRIVLNEAIFDDGELNVKITYRAGYTSIPADLQVIAIEVIGKKYKNIQDKRWGMTTISSAGESFGIFSDDLLPEHRRLLDMKYRHRGLE